MLSGTAESALRLMVQLASSGIAGSTVKQLALDASLSPGYAGSIVHNLGKAGLIHSKRGPTGGVRLARPADKITILEIVNANSPPKRLVAPLAHIKAGSLAKLNQCVDSAIEQLTKHLGRTTLADVVPRG